MVVSLKESFIYTKIQELIYLHLFTELFREDFSSFARAIWDLNFIWQTHVYTFVIFIKSSHFFQGKPASIDTFASFPVDWCLKTKVRFLSEKPFVLASQMKSKDEAAGTMSFVTQNVQQELKAAQVCIFGHTVGVRSTVVDRMYTGSSPTNINHHEELTEVSSCSLSDVK